MSVSIRLRREGRRNRPYYRVVVAPKQSKRDGKYLEQVGSYDPLLKDKDVELNLERVEYWISQGAKPSETVSTMVKKARKKKA